MVCHLYACVCQLIVNLITAVQTNSYVQVSINYLVASYVLLYSMDVLENILAPCISSLAGFLVVGSYTNGVVLFL